MESTDSMIVAYVAIKARNHINYSYFKSVSKKIGTTRIFNPQRIREGYSSRSVRVSVTMLAATYLVYASKER